MKTAIIVPVRLSSKRSPRKLLQEINGKPLIRHTADRIRKVAPEFPLYFAIENMDFIDVSSVLEGYECILTAIHICGTDRVAEANKVVKADYVINIQGDEPLVTRNQIFQLEKLAKEEGAGTLAAEQDSSVRVVLDKQGEALYFSRQPLPGSLGHLGMYSYRCWALDVFSEMGIGRLEIQEDLEQLRWLENGDHIAVRISSEKTIEVNTPEDLEAIQDYGVGVREDD